MRSVLGLPIGFLFLFSCICICGCGKRDEIQVAKVSGTITFCGQPLANARVMFVPVSAKAKNGLIYPVSFGQTDEEGRYNLSMPGGSTGAVVCSHRVFVSKIEPLIQPAELDKQMVVKAAEKLPQDIGGNGKSMAELAKLAEELAGLVEAKRQSRLRVAFLSATPFPRYKTRGGELVPATFNSETELRFTVEKKGSKLADFEVGFDR